MSGKYFPTMYFGGRAVAELIFQSTWHHGFFKIKSDIVVGKWWMNEWMNVGNISAPRKSNECSLKNVRPDWCLQRRCLSYLFTFGFICCMVIVEVWIRKAPISSYIWTIGSSCWCNYLERIWRYDLIGGCMSLWGGKFWGFKSSHDSQYFSLPPPLSPLPCLGVRCKLLIWFQCFGCTMLLFFTPLVSRTLTSGTVSPEVKCFLW